MQRRNPEREGLTSIECNLRASQKFSGARERKKWTVV